MRAFALSRKLSFGLSKLGARAPMLDGLPTPLAAYSTQRLLSSYTGKAVRVRRSDDNTEVDIGFSGNDLDIAAVWAACGNGVADLFITTWYNQLGDGKNLVQAGGSAQPKLVVAGALQVIGTRPAPRFLRAEQSQMQVTGFAAAQPWTRASVIQFLDVANGSNAVFLDNYNTALGGSLYTPDAATITMYRGASTNIYGALTEGFKAVIHELSNGAASKGIVNGAATVVSPGANGCDGLTVGMKRDTTLFVTGLIGEVIIFASGLSDTNLETLRLKQKTYWGTP